MRTFIVSDLHGNGNVYYSIMKYLDNISKEEDITLFINGDLIDRGMDSCDMLLDVKNRILENKFKIEYLGGNHELMMYQCFQRKKNKVFNPYTDVWYANSGWITDYKMEDVLDVEQEQEVVDFVSNLKICHLFDDKINWNNIVLVHAACPKNVTDEFCNMRIKDVKNNEMRYLWDRKNIGNKEYFSIVGHDPNDNKYGFQYNKKENYLNIDGGSAYYVSGFFKYDHVPLVEIKENYLKILTFNNNNEIIYGNYFNPKCFAPMSPDDLDKERSYLDHSFKPKKLVHLPDNIIGYEDWK